MAPDLSAVLLGLLLGIQHATDADHMVAVATIVSRTRRFGAGALVGAFWGVGHTLTLGAVGAAIIVLRWTVTPRVGLSLELAVAVMLMVLGVLRIARAVRGAGDVAPEHMVEPHRHHAGPAFHSHAHAHGSIVHRHPHVHPPAGLTAAMREVGVGQAVRSALVGVVHGLAGSAAVALLALGAIQDPTLAVGYLAVFGVGTIAGMTAITALLAWPFAVGARRLARWQHALAFGTGALSLAFGLYLTVHIGFVDGLFLSSKTRLAPEELLHAAGDPRRVEAVLGVETLGIARLAEAVDAELAEGRRHHLGEQLRHRAAQTTGDAVILHGDHPPGLARGSEDGLLVEGLDRGHVQHLGVDPVRLETLRRLERVPERPAGGEDGHVAARAQHLGATELEAIPVVVHGLEILAREA